MIFCYTEEMEQELKNIVMKWLSSGVEEQSFASFCQLVQNSNEPIEKSKQLWLTLLDNNWLRLGASGLYGLSPQAVSLADKTSVRLTKMQADELVLNMLERVYQWNAFAEPLDLPVIAAVNAWGSYANPNKDNFGDVDVSVLWRKGHPLDPSTVASIEPPFKCTLTDVWEIEDQVEEWVFHNPLINVSGIDQWEEFGKQDDFFQRVLYQDELLQQGNYQNIRVSEAQTYQQFVRNWNNLKSKTKKINR